MVQSEGDDYFSKRFPSSTWGSQGEPAKRIFRRLCVRWGAQTQEMLREEDLFCTRELASSGERHDGTEHGPHKDKPPPSAC